MGERGVILGDMGYQRGNRTVMLSTKNVLLALIVQFMLFGRKSGWGVTYTVYIEEKTLLM